MLLLSKMQECVASAAIQNMYEPRPQIVDEQTKPIANYSSTCQANYNSNNQTSRQQVEKSKLCNGCGLSIHKWHSIKPHFIHDHNNCPFKTHPQFNNDNSVSFVNSPNGALLTGGRYPRDSLQLHYQLSGPWSPTELLKELFPGVKSKRDSQSIKDQSKDYYGAH